MTLLGLLMLQTRFPRPMGDVGHAQTFDFAVRRAVVQGATDASRVCLVLAIAAAGIKTSIEELLQLGWKPLMLFVSDTLFIGLFVLLAVIGLGLAGAR